MDRPQLSNTAGIGRFRHVATDIVNLVYDIPLDENWKLSLGGGIGAGHVHAYAHRARRGTVSLVHGSSIGLAYQGIAGIAYSLSPDVDMFLDYRYREPEWSGNNVAASYTASDTGQGRCDYRECGDGRLPVVHDAAAPAAARRLRLRRRLRRLRRRLRLRRLRRRRRRTSSSSTSISRT